MADTSQLRQNKQRVVSGLREIVGETHVIDDPHILDTYAWQYVAELTTGTNYMERPLAVVLPGSTDEVAEIVRLCNRVGCQYKATSTGFGTWNGTTRPDSMVQIELRRMDRILEIDDRNMFAVIEPYVTGGQLQTELFKHRLNTHMAGSGAQTSVLASATSMMGQGWDGISLGFSNRNLLGVEWVTPDGRVARVGSVDASGSWFTGDGPGLSLRGAMRGFGGALGGLGVFTKCAVKVYPWHGPAQLETTGISPDYFTKIPPHHEAGILVVDDWDKIADVGYALGEAEVLDYLGRNAPSLVLSALTLDNNEFVRIYKVPVLNELYYAMLFVIIGQDAEDLDYKLKTLKKIVGDAGGGLLLSGFGPSQLLWAGRALRSLARRTGWGAILRSLPGLARLFRGLVRRFGARGIGYLNAMCYEVLIRQGMQMRGVFRFGGTFHTAMGSLVAWDNAIRGAKVGAQIKRKYIEEGVLFDDGGDNAWGGLYEGGTYSHLEELGCYDPRDPYCLEHANDYCIETNLASIDHQLGDCINGIGPGNHLLFSPHCWNYDTWQQRIKEALDPNGAAESSFYTDRAFNENPPERYVRQVERVRANRAPIVI